ncbi:Uncharacterised protein [Slackia heliotrinireducens]|uniref:Uncharacterized protein n=1 Tax=Slackia heliotrinireducens (strain ATCC 29202 / DSM 20476 / NCTC 11029 / RHS 1) TaxID=471855 RepID=C7N401_SLAHD|nr:hypothetical protein [Slackia heliotrinireducens]ACV23737.1 hypothetical protein Shel_27390 [Slackia heliotrinireducens DSM 20476]VEH03341.1 Uncharacterised protein [Slackia heliotrinireducens]
MSDIEVFELDDNFDPLEDIGLVDEEDIEHHDYQMPIPDAELSVVPEPVQLTPREKMDKLIAGIPGHKQRIVEVIRICEEPLTASEIEERLNDTYPQSASVYDAARIADLLVEAEGLVRLNAEEGADEETVAAPKTDTEHPEADVDAVVTPHAGVDETGDYLEVQPPEPSRYVATDEGLAFVAAMTDMAPVMELLEKEPRYLPIYERILRMTSNEEGCGKAELNKAIDSDELCQEPRRYTEYFLFRLQEVAAVRWNRVWYATDLGTSALNSNIFTK